MNTVKELLTRPSAVVSILVLVGVTFLVIAGEAISPHDPLMQNPQGILQGPSAAHWFGTDYLGRDVLSRIASGTKLSVLAALLAVAIAFLLGVFPAILSVYGGRFFEWSVLRVMDSFIALPFITFAIAMAALLGNGIFPAMVAVGILMAPGYFRVTRGAALSLNAAQYVEAARLLGVSTWRIVTDHIWRKVAPTVLVTTGGLLASGLLIVASLTFLGIGIQPPTPTWGGVLASDLRYLTQRPLGPLPAALTIMATVAAVGILSDHIRDITAPGFSRSWKIGRPLRSQERTAARLEATS